MPFNCISHYLLFHLIKIYSSHDEDNENPDNDGEAGFGIDSVSLGNNLPVEENGHDASQRRINLQERLATNPVGAQYNMDALLPRSNVKRHDVGSMTVTCSYCNAKGFSKERKKQKDMSVNLGRLCCNGGTSMFNNFPDLPDDLMNLYTGTDETAKYFQKYVRFFNAGMAMASMQVVNDQTIKKHGPGVFRIANVLYRRIGSITAPQGCTDTKCVQTYFLSPEEQDKHRARRTLSNNGNTGTRNIEADENIFSILRRIVVDECRNSFIHSFYRMEEYLALNNITPENVQLELIDPHDQPFSGIHEGRLNLPQAPEVAILIDPNFHRCQQRTFVCSWRHGVGHVGNQTQFFPVHHSSYTPMAYPLLLPFGTHGWGMQTKTIDGTKSSHLQFLRYHLVCRHLNRNCLHGGKTLFQQWLVDEYERLEYSRLQYIRFNQVKLRSETYNSVLISSRLGNSDIGSDIILPSSVTGTDRWYSKQYKNAMALVRVLGKPTLFVTFTLDIFCNEIKQHLNDCQVPYDRPDLLNRVFHVKYNELIHDIKQKSIFGKCIGFVSSVEFQKRGAPHVHILIWLENFNITAFNIDNIISAEIPPMGTEGSEERRLHDLVIEKMIHGPCGNGYSANLACRRPCGQYGQCNKKFPKNFNPSTLIVDDAYPLYRRRSQQDGGNVGYKFIRGVRRTIDNRWVVPYSPYLLLRFGCHCNVEYCNNLNMVKYLFKYQMKGGDMITINLPNGQGAQDDGQQARDEVKKFVHKRYISATYAHWRIMEYELVKMVPSVIKLKIHEEGEQSVLFEPNANSIQSQLNNASRTMLTEYFAANACPIRGATAVALLYEEFPNYFTWNSTEKLWTKRKRKVLQYGRMDSIHPAKTELYHLRLLLRHRRGVVSFEDLKTVDGEIMGSYQAAAIALGLCQDDQNHIDCMEDAIIWAMPQTLRRLYCTILTQCFPSNPRALLERFKSYLSEDFRRNYAAALNNGSISEDTVDSYSINDLLADIQIQLREFGNQMIDFGLDEPDTMLLCESTHVDLMADEFDIHAETFFQANRSRLTQDQENIFLTITKHIDEETGGLYAIDAPGGSGKTFLCNVILAYARKQNKIAIASALSGIAATLMVNGTTFHRRFGVPIDCSEDSTSSIKPASKEADVIRQACVIFVDEVSMMNNKLLDFLDRCLKTLMDNKEPMGNKLVVLLHDFRQLLPVVRGGSRGDIVHSCAMYAESWQYFRTLKLTKNMRVELLRQANNHDQSSALDAHSRWLLSLGDGTIDYVIPSTNIFEIPAPMACESLETLENRIYGDLAGNYTNPDYLKDRAIMSCTNEVIQQCNQSVVDRLPGTAVICESTHSFVNDDDNLRHDIGCLPSINPSGLPPHVLKLKPGACIILIRNLSLKDGHCNGTRYVILSITRRCILARKLNNNGPDDPTADIFIPRIPMTSKDFDYPVPFVRMQFPVLVAYYLTISRAQGQTFQKAGLYLPRNVFAHGHMYVGLSRCGNPNGLHVYSDQTEFAHLQDKLDKDRLYSKNVVFQEVLHTH